MVWLQILVSKLSWGTQMPKSDKKENITQLKGNSLHKTSTKTVNN
jgi:hypothetical protein